MAAGMRFGEALRLTTHRRGRVREILVAAVAGLALGVSALAGGMTHSQIVDLAIIAELGLFVTLAVGDFRRMLLIAIVFDIPMQWSKSFGWDQSAANLGALGGLNISVTTIALAGLYGLWAWQSTRPGSAVPKARWKPAAPLVVYVAVETASLTVARDRVLGGYEIALLLQTLLLFVYIVSTVRTRADLQLITTALVASLLLESALIVALRFTGRGFHFLGLTSHGDPAVAGSDQRLGGTVGAPNTAAAFLCLMVPLAAGRLLAPSSRGVRRLCIISIAAGIAALIVTQSRGGWISLSISATVLGIFAVRRGLLPARAAVVALAVIIIALAPFYATIVHRLSAPDQGSAHSRVTLATIAWHMIEDHSLLGVGVNNTALNVHSYAGPQFDGTFIYAVHDKYLLVWSEAGIFALLAFLWFLVATIGRGWSASRAGDRLLSPIALGLTAGIIGQLVHMGVDLFQSRPQVESLWLVAALLTAANAITGREQALQRFERPPLEGDRLAGGRERLPPKPRSSVLA